MILGTPMLPGRAGILGVRLPEYRWIPEERVPEACGLIGPLGLPGRKVSGVI
jgi:hypothetical protein